MLRGLLIYVGIIMLCSAAAQATPLNRWSVSCSVDRGAIVQKRKMRVFTTSSNRCPGGVFTQRAEIKSEKISPNHRGTYLFSATLSMTNDRNEKFDVFQMHDGRHGCSPPLKVTVMPDNRLKLEADYKTGPGESCERDVFRQTRSDVRFKRDGTPQKLEAIVQFKGQANFAVQVMLDGQLAAQGVYAPPKGAGYFQSKHFYFKHGVYSLNMFEYRLVSEDMRVKRIRAKK